MDELYIAMFILYIVLFIVNIFVNSLILSILIWALIILAVLRSFSRNIPKRRKENAVFMKYYGAVASFFKLQKRRIKDRKTHVYVKCPRCKSVLRLPKREGKNTAKCPKCANTFTVE